MAKASISGGKAVIVTDGSLSAVRLVKLVSCIEGQDFLFIVAHALQNHGQGCMRIWHRTIARWKCDNKHYVKSSRLSCAIRIKSYYMTLGAPLPMKPKQGVYVYGGSIP